MYSKFHVKPHPLSNCDPLKKPQVAWEKSTSESWGSFLHYQVVFAGSYLATMGYVTYKPTKNRGTYHGDNANLSW